MGHVLRRLDIKGFHMPLKVRAYNRKKGMMLLPCGIARCLFSSSVACVELIIQEEERIEYK